MVSQKIMPRNKELKDHDISWNQWNTRTYIDIESKKCFRWVETKYV